MAARLVEVDAVCWDGRNHNEVCDWLTAREIRYLLVLTGVAPRLEVTTPAGVLVPQPGQWIVSFAGGKVAVLDERAFVDAAAGDAAG